MLKICAIDLDGVLVDYPYAWINYVNQQLNEHFTNLHELKDSLTFNQYKKLKYAYRTSGIKATLSQINGASELTKMLRLKGYLIIILTARPLYEIPEVFRDTLLWLRNNNICYDTLFVGKDKHIKILKYFKDLNFIIEDNAEIANSIAEHGYKVFLLDNEYNQQKLHNNVTRIYSLNEVVF
jgi:uncharacterized HAD superfamily protein